MSLILRVVSFVNFRNYVNGYMNEEDVKNASFIAEAVSSTEEGPIVADMSRPPLDPESQLAMHKDWLNEGLGVMENKGELATTEIIKPDVKKRVFSAWRTDRPSGFGFLISKYNIKVYLFRWTFGIGWIPEEVVWQREEMKSSRESYSDEGQKTIT